MTAGLKYSGMTQLLTAALGLLATMLTVKVSPEGTPDGCQEHKCHVCQPNTDNKSEDC